MRLLTLFALLAFSASSVWAQDFPRNGEYSLAEWKCNDGLSPFNGVAPGDALKNVSRQTTLRIEGNTITKEVDAGYCSASQSATFTANGENIQTGEFVRETKCMNQLVNTQTRPAESFSFVTSPDKNSLALTYPPASNDLCPSGSVLVFRVNLIN